MIVAILLIAVLLFFLKVKQSAISMPSTLFCLIWAFFILGAIFLLGKEYMFYYKGVYWIIGLCFCVSLFSVNAEKNILAYSETSEKQDDYVTAEIPWFLLFVILILSFLSVIVTLRQNGLGFRIFGNFNSLSDISYQMTVQRYSGEDNGSTLAVALGVFMQASGLCSGYSLIHTGRKTRHRVLCLLSIIPVILSTLLTTAKLSLVTFTLFFATGYYIAYINRYHRLPHINGKIIRRILLIFIILAAVFYMTFVFRLHGSVTNTAQIVISKLANYAFGHVQGFDVWFSIKMSEQDTLGFGAYSFMAISSRLGITKKIQGVYTIVPGSCTNVYSPFRGIIEDFGPILGFAAEVLVFLFLLWLIEELIVSRNNSVWLQTIAASQLFYFLFVFISYWVYTTYILTFFVFAAFLMFTYRVKVTPKTKVEFVLGNRR